MKASIVSFAEDASWIDDADKLDGDAFGPYILEAPVPSRYWAALFEEFPQFQFCVRDEAGAFVGTACAVPVYWGGAVDALPDEGFDWALPAGVEGRRSGRRPNLLCALSVNVVPSQREKGYSAQLLRVLADSAREHGLSGLIVPVRPTYKSRHPVTDMADYLAWKTPDGRCFDPWVRLHLSLGARVVGICRRSLTHEAPIERWSAWTGLHFPGTGRFIVPGALAPLEVDFEAGTAIYREPNVWMQHPLPGEARVEMT